VVRFFCGLRGVVVGRAFAVVGITLIFAVLACEPPEHTTQGNYFDATYRGFTVSGEVHGQDWQCRVIHITAPQEIPGLSVQLGNQPAVPFKDLTAEMVQRYERSVRGSTFIDDRPDAGPKLLTESTEVDFDGGKVIEARFLWGKWEGIRLFKDGRELSLPMRKQEFELLFGEPREVRRYDRGV
jgi:hypothetical protein